MNNLKIKFTDTLSEDIEKKMRYVNSPTLSTLPMIIVNFASNIVNLTEYYLRNTIQKNLMIKLKKQEVKRR